MRSSSHATMNGFAGRVPSTQSTSCGPAHDALTAAARRSKGPSSRGCSSPRASSGRCRRCATSGIGSNGATKSVASSRIAPFSNRRHKRKRFFLPFLGHFFCSTAPQAFFRRDRRFRTPARAEAVKAGRSLIAATNASVFSSFLGSFLLFDRAAGFLPPRPWISDAGARRGCQGRPSLRHRGMLRRFQAAP